MDWIKLQFTSYEFLSFYAIYTYWVPTIICLSVYFVRMIELYRSDLTNCEKEYYNPSLTIGLIIWYFSISIIPVINGFALLDCSSSVLKWLSNTFSIPLVRKQYVKTPDKEPKNEYQPKNVRRDHI